MTPEHHDFRLPVQKLSARADRKIRLRLWQAKFKQASGFEACWMLLTTRTVALALLLIVALPAAGLGFQRHVYNSPSIIRGDRFYSFKRSQETKRLTALQDPAERAQYYFALSQRRMQEAEHAITRGPAFALFLQRAHAQSLGLGDSIVAGLVVESNGLFIRGLHTVDKVEQSTVRTSLLQSADRVLKENTVALKAIQPRLPVDDINQQALVQAVRSLNVDYHREVDAAVRAPEAPSSFGFKVDTVAISFDDADDLNSEIQEFFHELEELEDKWEHEVEEFFEAVEHIEHRLERIEAGFEEFYDDGYEDFDWEEEEAWADEDRFDDDWEDDDEDFEEYLDEEEWYEEYPDHEEIEEIRDLYESEDCDDCEDCEDCEEEEFENWEDDESFEYIDEEWNEDEWDIDIE